MEETQSSRIEKAIRIYGENPALWVALRSVCDNPHQVLQVETPFVSVGEAKSLEASQLGVSILEPGAVANTDRMRHFMSRGEKWRFLRVFDRRVVRSDDNDANRFVSFFVCYSLKLLKNYSYVASGDKSMHFLLPALRRLIRRLNLIWSGLSPSFKYAQLRVLPLDNQLLQFHPQYHVILSTYLEVESMS